MRYMKVLCYIIIYIKMNTSFFNGKNVSLKIGRDKKFNKKKKTIRISVDFRRLYFIFYTIKITKSKTTSLYRVTFLSVLITKMFNSCKFIRIHGKHFLLRCLLKYLQSNPVRD